MGFRLDRLDHGVVAFMAEEGISLCRTPKIKAMPRFSLGDLSKRIKSFCGAKPPQKLGWTNAVAW
jgi:hypothetical protein